MSQRSRTRPPTRQWPAPPSRRAGPCASLPHPGWAEHDAKEVWWEDFVSICRELLERADEGVAAVCSSGIGMSIAANKVPGVRAAVISDVEAAKLSRQHNDANVIAIGARLTPAPRAAEIVRIFLQTGFDGGRHQNRVAKIGAIERLAR